MDRALRGTDDKMTTIVPFPGRTCDDHGCISRQVSYRNDVDAEHTVIEDLCVLCGRQWTTWYGWHPYRILKVKEQ